MPVPLVEAFSTRLEHAVEMFRQVGGGVFGDLAPELPACQLAILPGTTHVGMLERAGWISQLSVYRGRGAAAGDLARDR